MPGHYSLSCPSCGWHAFQLSGADSTGRTATCLKCGEERLAGDMLAADQAALPRAVQPAKG